MWIKAMDGGTYNTIQMTHMSRDSVMEINPATALEEENHRICANYSKMFDGQQAVDVMFLLFESFTESDSEFIYSEIWRHLVTHRETYDIADGISELNE